MIYATRSANEELRRDVPGQTHRGATHRRGAAPDWNSSAYIEFEAWRVVAACCSVPIILIVLCLIAIRFCS